MLTIATSLTKRSCTGDHCYTDIALWKIIVCTVLPVSALIVAIVYFFGVRNMNKLRKLEAAENRYDSLDWEEDEPYVNASTSTQRVDSFYGAQKPGYARSTTASSFTTLTPSSTNLVSSPSQDKKENPFVYQMEEYSNSMIAVPLVKDSSYILPPTDDSDNWGYIDPVTQMPNRTHSPMRGMQSRKGQL